MYTVLCMNWHQHKYSFMNFFPLFQIKCQCCGTVSEREEEFQDIPVALSSRAGLEDALKDSYIESETLDGANQYHCSNCNKLVDAKRV